MKKNESQKQSTQTAQKDQAVVRVQSKLRAGVAAGTEKDTCI